MHAVLFDLDGTLINTVSLILSSFRHATREVLGRVIADEELMANVGVPLIKQMREFDEARAEELLRVYREHNAAHHDDAVTEYPGTEETLESLRVRGVRMGVVTSKGTEMTRRGMRLFGLERFFEAVVTADDVLEHKPDPHPLLHAARLLDVDVTHCIYVGDSPHDMASAKAAGAIGVAALWGAFASDNLLEPEPEYALKTIRDLPALIWSEERRFRNGW